MIDPPATDQSCRQIIQLVDHRRSTTAIMQRINGAAVPRIHQPTANRDGSIVLKS
ncbi:MAG TPA: hypothetical protein VHD56_15555 [Tepidisphaeraceae bacterium]|nr:hypothetical protein [Tepidisphaeraceae bacterium]